MRKPRHSYKRLVGAVGIAATVCAGISACTRNTTQTAKVSESGWGAGDTVGRQLFDTKLRAQRGQSPISKTMADAQASRSDD